jgi:hypothetical protein
MKTYREIRAKAQNKRSILFDKCRLFWAFSNQQFNENKTELKEGEKYVSIGAGGYLPKSEVKNLTKGLEIIRKWENSEIKKQKDGKNAHILYELNNHECFYTGSIESAEAVLPYPRRDILKVYHKERMKHQAQEDCIN